ncbi:MAG: DUF4199 domain-containing protein [Bacteroidales bacterium]
MQQENRHLQQDYRPSPKQSLLSNALLVGGIFSVVSILGLTLIPILGSISLPLLFMLWALVCRNYVREKGNGVRTSYGELLSRNTMISFMASPFCGFANLLYAKIIDPEGFNETMKQSIELLNFSAQQQEMFDKISESAFMMFFANAMGFIFMSMFVVLIVSLFYIRRKK